MHTALGLLPMPTTPTKPVTNLTSAVTLTSETNYPQPAGDIDNGYKLFTNFLI
jgi:hypothetical protein